MSTNQPSPNISIQPKDVVGRGGPMAGSAISIVGALLALFGFVLPWASCGSIQLSGMDIASQSLSGELGNTQGVFICLVPFFALGVLGVALIVAPASLWKKIPAGAKLIGTLLVGILAVLALCPACLFYFQLQNARTDPSNYGFGYLVKVEYGFWITVFGLFVALVGGILGMGASAADLFMKKKDTQEPPVAG